MPAPPPSVPAVPEPWRLRPPRTYQGRGFRRATMPTPIPIYSLPFFTIEQMRAVDGVLRGYINDVAPTTNDAEDYNPPAELAEVSAALCHLDAAIEAYGRPLVTHYHTPSSAVDGSVLRVTGVRVSADGVHVDFEHAKKG
jgi:hypothetical protein